MENLNLFKLFFFRIYHFIFIERFFKKLFFDFPKNVYRWDLIQMIINKYNFENYLEIGCDKDQLFSKIRIKNKVGVDPISGGTIRSTSDIFFLKNPSNHHMKPTLILIYLHYYNILHFDIVQQTDHIFYFLQNLL